MDSYSLSEESIWLLTAMQLRGIGPVAVRKLYRELISSSKEVRKCVMIEQQNRLISSLAMEKEALRKADGILSACCSHDIGIATLFEEQYPHRLRSVKDAPPIIYYKGSVEALHKNGCAVVGTRRASDVGGKIAYKIASLLAVRGYAVVSGLALGIDSAAHRGALSSEGSTIAVLAHGLDVVHPSSNKPLAQLILKAQGALVSEHQPGVPPRPAEFVRRNRIQSGMSICSIIVESGSKGGAIHQANFTVEQGRPLYVVAPDINNPHAVGFNWEGAASLIETNKAVPLKSSGQLIQALTGHDTINSPVAADKSYQQNLLF